MNMLLTISSIFIFLTFVFSRIVKYKRFKHVTNLKRVYGKMEMHFVRTNTHLNKDLREFLRAFKNLSENPEYLDIQILVLAARASRKKGVLEKNRAWLDKTLKSLGDDFSPLFIEFDQSANKVVIASIFKPDFVLFFSAAIIRLAIHQGFGFIKKIVRDFRFIQDNDEAISYSAMQMRMS